MGDVYMLKNNMQFMYKFSQNYTPLHHLKHYVKRKPFKVLYSSIIPGGGSFFNNKKFKGIIVCAVQVGSFVWAFKSIDIANDKYKKAEEAALNREVEKLKDYYNDYKDYRKDARTGFTICATATLWNIVDALLNVNYIKCEPLTKGNGARLICNVSF